MGVKKWWGCRGGWGLRHGGVRGGWVGSLRVVCLGVEV